MRFPFAGPRHAPAVVVPPPPVAPPPPPPPPPPAVRTDLTLLLGRSLGDHLTQEVLREWALLPGLGAGPARSLLSPDLGVSLAADEYGRIAMIFLHFHGDAGFQPYPGAIPGRGGTIPKRNSLMAALGRPDPGTTGQWSFPTFTMYALYAADDENLLRLTLRAAQPLR